MLRMKKEILCVMAESRSYDPVMIFANGRVYLRQAGSLRGSIE